MQLRNLLLQSGKNLILIGMVATVYFLLGLLSQLFRVPSVQISILMPSAGLALATTLLFGTRVLPAVAIGNFCVNAWLSDFNPTYIPFYAASGLGAVLSAGMGASLVRKVVGFPDPLVEGRKIIHFLCLAGPVSCLIPSVFAITVMHAQGIISLKEIPLATFRWWMADILGVVIFSPLILVLFAQPYRIWYRRRSSVGLPVLLMFTLAIVLFSYMDKATREEYNAQLNARMITLSEALKSRVQLDLSSVHGLRNYLSGAQAIEPQDFSLLVKQSLQPLKEIQSVRWLNITERTKEDSQFIHVFNDKLGSKPETLLKIPPELKQRLLASPSLSGSDILVAEDNGFKLYTPVSKGLGQNKKVLGVIVSSVTTEHLVQETLEKLNTSRCPITISTTQTGLSSAKMIYSNAGGLEHTPCLKTSFEVAGQVWELSFYHDWTREKIGGQQTNEWIIFTGLWFIGLLGIILLHQTGRNVRTEAIIDERTKKLTETKIAAEQANQAKNQFLAKISHELRTPLNGIAGFTQLLEKKPNLNDEDKKQVGIIRQCSDDLLRLINDILDISAIESHQIKLEAVEFNFTLLLTDSIRICKFRADEKGIKLHTKNTCLPFTFLGDEKRIRQILVNLIDNAIKYTNKGSVTVITSYLDGILSISVSDTGSGIAQKDLERIFSPFVQVNIDNFTSDGIGLGLSITKEIVHLMDGDVAVNSQPGQGSTFTVSLPLPVSEKNQVKVRPELPSEASTINNAKVLVADDSEINLIFLVSLLEQLGCQVDSSTDGKQALALIEQNPYDFALIDINMPVMNGLELAKVLRSQKSKLKLIAVSAFADNGKISEALNAGFDAYITKPIEEVQLVELIQAS